MALLDDLIYGDPAETWLGFSPAIIKLNDYKITLHNAINDIQFYFSNQNWIDSDLTALFAMNDAIYTDFGN